MRAPEIGNINLHIVKASATVTLSSIVDVKSVWRYYKLQASTLSKPNKPTKNPPEAGWTTTEPSYTNGSTNNLYFCDLTVFSDDTFVYSDVSLSSSYEAAKSAYNKASTASNIASEAKKTAENAKAAAEEGVAAAKDAASKAQAAADKAQADANANTKAVAKAQSAADAAKKAAADAQEKAENVESNLESANAVIEQHSNKLGELSTKVSNAVTNAASALTASTEAKQTATEASTTANTAYRDSQTAITNSTKATQTATEAKTTAESAVTTANDSLKQSSSAVQTANRIQNTLTTDYQTKADSDLLYATKSSLTETSESIKMEVSANYATKSTVEALRNVADNAIESWRGSGVPTSENKPASDWTTTEEKKRHSGDLYYDKDTGKAYRWGSDDGIVYSWVLNQDTDITKALRDASNAQKSADNAQTTANGAVTAAGNAQKSADGAQSTADRANTAANNAQKTADSVQTDVDQLKIDIPNTYATKASLETTANSITAQVESVSTTANSAVTAASKAQQTADAINVNLTKNYQTKENADNIYATKATLTATSESLSTNITKAQQTADGAVNAASNAQQTADAININLTKNYQTTKDADDKYATQTSLNATAESITSTVSQTYATKTEVTDAVDGLANTVETTYSTKSEVKQLSDQVSSTVTEVTTVKNDLSAAKKVADDAALAASRAQQTANDAKTDAATAQSTADTAKANAATAQSKADEAARNLAAAEENLNNLQNQADATDEQVAAAKIAVENAKKAADAAQADATIAKNDAATAQDTANTAKANAATAQSTADTAKANAKTAQDDVNALKTRVTTAETSIKQNSDAIALRATKTEVNSAIDGISVGGRNLFYRTKDTPIGISGSESNIGRDYYLWGSTLSPECSLTKTADGLKLVYGSNAGIGVQVPLAEFGNVENGDIVTLSFTYRGNIQSFGEFYFLQKTEPNAANRNFPPLNSDGLWHKYSYTFSNSQANARTCVSCLLFYNNPQYDNSKWIEIKAGTLKLEKGNKATDWSPAPEDLIVESEKYIDKLSIGGRNYIANSLLTRKYVIVESYDIYTGLWTITNPNNWAGGCLLYNTKTLPKGTYSCKFGKNIRGFLCTKRFGKDTIWLHNDYYSKLFDSGEAYVVQVNQGVPFEGFTATEEFQFGLVITDSITSEQVGPAKLELGNKPTDWSPAPEDIAEESKTYTDAQLKITSDSITSTVSKTYATKTSVDTAIQTSKTYTDTELTQTSEEIRFDFNKSIASTSSELQSRIDDNDVATNQKLSEINKYIRFVNGNIILGETGNELMLTIQNNRISFTQSGVEVAFFSNDKLHINKAEVLTSMKIGNYELAPRTDGGLALRKWRQ